MLQGEEGSSPRQKDPNFFRFWGSFCPDYEAPGLVAWSRCCQVWCQEARAEPELQKSPALPACDL